MKEFWKTNKQTSISCHSRVQNVTKTDTLFYASFSSIACSIKWKWKSISCVQLFGTPWTIQSMDILQARILEWTAVPFSRKSSQAGIKPRFPTWQADSLPVEPPGKPKNTGLCSLSLLQWIFLTQDSNQHLLHCRQILYQLNYQGSPKSCTN